MLPSSTSTTKSQATPHSSPTGESGVPEVAQPLMLPEATQTTSDQEAKPPAREVQLTERDYVVLYAAVENVRSRLTTQGATLHVTHKFRLVEITPAVLTDLMIKLKGSAN